MVRNAKQWQGRTDMRLVPNTAHRTRSNRPRGWNDVTVRLGAPVKPALTPREQYERMLRMSI